MNASAADRASWGSAGAAAAPLPPRGGRARQERVSAEIASGLGVRSDGDLDDPLPF
jgi:hypothetical protein